MYTNMYTYMTRRGVRLHSLTFHYITSQSGASYTHIVLPHQSCGVLLGLTGVRHPGALHT